MNMDQGLFGTVVCGEGEHKGPGGKGGKARGKDQGEKTVCVGMGCMWGTVCMCSECDDPQQLGCAGRGSTDAAAA